MAIENECFDDPWTYDDFTSVLSQRDVIGLVTEVEHEVTGFCVYRANRQDMELINLGVPRRHRRSGYGASLLNRVKDRVRSRGCGLVAVVRETNLGAQLFLKTQGMRAVVLFREHFEDSGEDAYLMEYRPPAQGQPSQTKQCQKG